MECVRDIRNGVLGVLEINTYGMDRFTPKEKVHRDLAA